MIAIVRVEITKRNQILSIDVDGEKILVRDYPKGVPQGELTRKRNQLLESLSEEYEEVRGEWIDWTEIRK